MTLRSKLGSRGEEGQIWIDYLRLDPIIDAAEVGRITPELVETVNRFEGVSRNPELRWMQLTAGFDSTYRLLNQWVAYEPLESTPVDQSMPKPIRGTETVPPEPQPPTSPTAYPRLGEELLPEPIPTPTESEPI